MSALLLVRYGELALKSPPVRREFERTLQRNILEQFAAARSTCRLRNDRGHFYVESDDAEAAALIVRRVFGVTSVSVVWEVSTDRPELTRRVIELSDALLGPGRSFAVRARRTGEHPFTSQELARDLGSEIIARFSDRQLRVDLDHPDVEVFVEVRGPRTYLYFGRQRGPGGLPLGVAGRVVALVDGTRGALGAFLMMKRGCRCDLVATANGADLARRILGRFDPRSSVELAPGTGEEAEVAMRTAADSHHADGIVLPLTIDAYAEAHARWGDRVVFSPTVGLTDEEVEHRWHDVQALAG
ncbi:MAG: THUMP domain-containing protein [Thermoplasmata archaeon]